MLAGINMFWVRLRLILALAVERGLKWALRRAQNIFMLKNMNSISSIITLDGTDKIKTERKWQQNGLKNISFTNDVRKRQQTL